MGRRSFGGRSPSVLDRSVILRRLESCKNKSTFDEIVDYLRSNYPDYRRIKQQPFSKYVQQTLEFQQRKKLSASTSNGIDDDDDTNAAPSQSPARKKLKKIDYREERLLRTETEYVRRKQNQAQDLRASTSSSSSSSSDSSSSDDEKDGAVSTSEDAIYEEKVEPEFDLMKSMLRSSYSASKKVETKVEEKNLEVEVVNKAKKIEMVEGNTGERLGQKKLTTELKGSRERELRGEDGSEVKRKDGPRFKDLGGIKGVLDELMMEVIIPLYHPQLPRWLGVRPMAGILLHGPPGCGKTKLAHAIANETGVPFYKISATEVVSGVSGASEENIRDLFSKAYRTAPSIVFIDEIDAIASKRENLQREMERRIVTQLMTCMDESHQVIGTADVDLDSESSDCRPGYVLVIGATNRPDAVDPALRRPGRFDREIVLGVPDENARMEILSVLTQNLKLEGMFDLAKIARSTPGFVGADLAALANKAGNLAMKRIIDRRKSELSREPKDGEHAEEWWRQPWAPEEMEMLSITMADFEEAAKMVQPSSRREGFSAIPNVKWGDVGGLDLLRKEFDRYIVRRIKHPEDYEEFGVDMETGFLLYGPPGCGKTLIAKAVANEAGANFIHIKGPELLNKYVGESELAVRTIFSRARTCSPCILFFDEVDALTTIRGKEGGWVVERLLNQLLIELDGADQRRGVFVIGATNRPEVMDRAVLRPGRFGKLLYVPLPDPDERGLILKALARKKPVDADVDLLAIGRQETCENLSGADLAAVMNEAAMAALEEKQTLGQCSSDAKTWTIKSAHFEYALKKISPSVSQEQKRFYEVLSQSFRAA
ncbi:PREDICTED: cell division control protein 48 homolog C [Nelumbo nucifera]|uniref:Cell division control protein 48 homolog C n=1 Tax=Nelumbo nucifera TaxID=4432 RepID=A0A1U7ZSM6_NELNU|nr:PREDICTED: cell division control protein 48 homolog C [Nelumbo nucifera]